MTHFAGLGGYYVTCLPVAHVAPEMAELAITSEVSDYFTMICIIWSMILDTGSSILDLIYCEDWGNTQQTRPNVVLMLGQRQSRSFCFIWIPVLWVYSILFF